MIEESGGAVVCMENCTGVKGLDLLVDENAKDPFCLRPPLPANPLFVHHSKHGPYGSA